MDMNLLTENVMEKITVKVIDPMIAKEICLSMTEALPEWLRTPTAQARYEQGKHNRIFFAACRDNEYIGMMAVELAAPHNAHINWMVVSDTHHFQSIGAKLLLAAENHCYESGYTSITVEALNHTQNDKHINSNFYEKSGYKPIFEMYPYDAHHLMVYMLKTLSLDDFTFIDLTHSLSSDVPHWGIDVGFKYNARTIQSIESTGGVKFRVQRLEMSSGIGTHMDAPSHCFEKATAIDGIPLQSLITVCRVIDVSSKVHDRYSVTPEDVSLFEDEYGIIPKGAFVIIYTGWDQRWKLPDQYRNNKIFPNISIEAAKMLISRDIAGIGIDTLSPDAFGSEFPVHQLILGAGKYIIENVANANQLDARGSFILALPMKITDGTEAPIRLVGMKRKTSM